MKVLKWPSELDHSILLNWVEEMNIALNLSLKLNVRCIRSICHMPTQFKRSSQIISIQCSIGWEIHPIGSIYEMQYHWITWCSIRWIFCYYFCIWIDWFWENIYVLNLKIKLSISGVEERLAREKYIQDDSEGIIPRATRYLWQIMA